MMESRRADAGFRSLSELEGMAAERVPSGVWDYIQGGSGEERTLRANREAFHRRTLLPRVLTGTGRIDPSTSLLGKDVRAPFYVAPTAYQGQIHPEGECGTVAAAASAGVMSMLSTLSTFAMEEVGQSAGEGLRWFQLYLQPEFAQTVRLVRRAQSAGFRAIVLTVDVPLLAVRDRQSKEGFALDTPVPLGNGAEFVTPAREPQPDGSAFRLRPDGAATWEVIDRLREASELPVVVKGILRSEDARRAVEHGAVGVVVSNHGGRQLDGAPASLDVLSEIVAAVGPKAEVYLDGGIRRASDVLIALALGARAVGIGRPVLWALAVGGRAGVAQYFELLRAELVNSMAQVGVGSLSELNRTMVRETPS